MIISEQPIAKGAMATPCVTVRPIVITRKKVPINSVKYFADTLSPLVEKLDGRGLRRALFLASVGKPEGDLGDVNNKAVDFAWYELAITATSFYLSVFAALSPTRLKMLKTLGFLWGVSTVTVAAR